MKRAFRTLVLIAVMAATTVSCTGGGTGGTGISGGTGGTGLSYGTLTAFGSVFVNDVEFNTSGAAITLNGASGSGAHGGLKIGMVVRVRGTIDAGGTTGTAVSVAYTDDTKGPVSSITAIDATTSDVMVLGRRVILDAATVFENTTFATLAVNNVIEVSGLTDQNGFIRASYVRKKKENFTPGDDIEVKGVIQGLNTVAGTFLIDALTVNYAAADTHDLPGGVPVNGLYVEVKGDSFGLAGELLATSVAAEDEDLAAIDSDEAELEGYVTSMVAADQFMIGSRLVQTAPATKYIRGAATDIAPGVKLEAEGQLVNGVLLAAKVIFKDALLMESDVASVNLAAGSLTLTGLPGITITINELTRFSGAATGPGDIAPGDHVSIRARRDDGAVLATSIEERAASTTARLQGAVASVSNPSLVILGVTVDTSTIPDPLGFTDAGGTVLGASTFFSRVQVGKYVLATGTLAGVVVTWGATALQE
jgi:hypothetical protein